MSGGEGILERGRRKEEEESIKELREGAGRKGLEGGGKIGGGRKEGQESAQHRPLIQYINKGLQGWVPSFQSLFRYLYLKTPQKNESFAYSA